MNYSGLKAGDRVWLGHDNRKGVIKVVHHLTATQVVVDLDGRGFLVRYKVDNGERVGRSFMAESIVDVATPEECQMWDARQAQERQKEAESNAEKKRIEAKRQALYNLFGLDVMDVWVRAERWGKEAERKGKWTVELHNLTEEQVAALAGRLAVRS